MNNEESAALKHLRDVWVKAKIAKTKDVPTYYTTSKGITLDLRAIDGYNVTQGLTVTRDYRNLMGLKSTWVGS